jgi:type I restriction enzyme R subunit
MASGLEWILGWMRDAATKETTDEGRKKVLRAFQDAVLALSKAFALAGASDQAREIRE